MYIPCGVGGAPGGITFGLKHEFGDCVKSVFIEPVQAPCMLLGMSTGLHNHVAVQDIGLTGKTAADGLAVGRPSGFVGKTMETLVSGIMTVEDRKLFDYMRALLSTEGVFIEPSACAAFQGVVRLSEMEKTLESIHGHLDQAAHVVWATGGSMVPPDEIKMYCEMFLD